MSVPSTDGPALVTDGGLETDLIFHHGIDLPEFAAFPLVDHDRSALEAYFSDYVDIARRAGAGLVLATPTWRASPEWGRKVGYDAADLERVNRRAVALLHELRERCADLPDLSDVVVSGVVGPRGDGYVAGETPRPEEAADSTARRSTRWPLPEPTWSRRSR